MPYSEESDDLIIFLFFLTRLGSWIVLEAEIYPVAELLISLEYAGLDYHIPPHHTTREVHLMATFLFETLVIYRRIDPTHEFISDYAYTHLILYHIAESSHHLLDFMRDFFSPEIGGDAMFEVFVVGHDLYWLLE